MTEPARVDGLTVTTPAGEPVVTDVGFAVARGETLGVVGRSGSGKTTVALALLGYVRPGLVRRGGTVRIGGIDPFTTDGARRVRGRVATYLGQDPAAALNPARRIGAQIAEAVRLRAPERPAAEETARLLGSLGLPTDPAFRRRRPHEISGGQARRTALALALAGDPALLVLDEPTAGLDTVLAASVRELLAEVVVRTAVVLVSHDAHLVAALASRTLVLRDARVVAQGSNADVLAAELAPTPSPGPEPRPPGGEPVLTVRALGAHHGPTPVLTDVDLEVSAGECVAVVGASGAGKSTLVRCVAGLHRPSAGTVGGVEARGVGLVLQDPVGALNPRETVARALARPLRRTGLRGGELTGRAQELLARVHLRPDLLGRRPAALSGGERQRVTLARALAAGPRLLLCDEVTASLDPTSAAAVADLIDELRRTAGVGVLLVTHDLPLAQRLAHRVVVLDGGRIVESGPTAEVFGAPRHPSSTRLVAAAPALAPG